MKVLKIWKTKTILLKAKLKKLLVHTEFIAYIWGEMHYTKKTPVYGLQILDSKIPDSGVLKSPDSEIIFFFVQITWKCFCNQRVCSVQKYAMNITSEEDVLRPLKIENALWKLWTEAVS